MNYKKTAAGVLIDGFPSIADVESFLNGTTSVVTFEETGGGFSYGKYCLSASGDCYSASMGFRQQDLYSMGRMIYGGTQSPGREALIMTAGVDPQVIKNLVGPLDILLGIKVNFRNSIFDMADATEKDCCAIYIAYGSHLLAEAPPAVGSASIMNLTPWGSYDMESWNHGYIYDPGIIEANLKGLGPSLYMATTPHQTLHWICAGPQYDDFRYSELNGYDSAYTERSICHEEIPYFYKYPLFDSTIHYPGRPLTYSVGNVEVSNEGVPDPDGPMRNYLRLHSLNSMINGYNYMLIEVGIPLGYIGSYSIIPSIESVELVFIEGASRFWTGFKNCVET